MSARAHLIHLVAIAAWLACDSPPQAACPGCVPQAIVEKLFATAVARDLDVLLVADTTAQADALRQQVVAELPAALDGVRIGGALPSLHFGVVAAGTGLGAVPCAPAQAQPPSSCAIDPAYGYLATGPCGAYYVSTEPPTEVAACLADLPEAACDAGDPLEVLARSLGDPAAAGLGGLVAFLRPRARLLIIVASSLSDSGTQDAAPSPSPRPARAIVDEVQALKDDPNLVTVIVLTPPGSCGGAAAPDALDPRLRDFADAWGANSAVGRACPGVFAGLFDRLNASYDTGIFCVSGLEDTDPQTNGIQPDCHVEAVTYDDAGAVTARVLPECANPAPSLPCWRFVPFSYCSPGLLLDIQQEPGFCPQGNMSTRLTCLSDGS